MKSVRTYLGFLKNVGLERSGQALVETALVVPILTICLVGVTELAKVARASIAATDAAKAGVQYAIQNGFTAEDATGIQKAAAADAPSLTTLTTTSSYTCICSDGTTPASCNNTACPGSYIEEDVTVNTSATVTPGMHLPALPRSFTVSGSAVGRCLQ